MTNQYLSKKKGFKYSVYIYSISYFNQVRVEKKNSYIRGIRLKNNGYQIFCYDKATIIYDKAINYQSLNKQILDYFHFFIQFSLNSGYFYIFQIHHIDSMSEFQILDCPLSIPLLILYNYNLHQQYKFILKMEQLVSLLQKKQLQKEERLKSLIKIIDRRIVQKLYNLRNYAFLKIRNFKIANRNNVKLISEKDDDKGTYQINISNTNQFREALYQLQNYNLVQLEILKKETLCRMVYILQKRVNHHYRHLIIKLINKKPRNIIPFLKVFTYRFNYQSRFLKILQKFQRNREIQLLKEMKKQEAISKFVMALENKKLHCFCTWKRKFQINQNEQSYIDNKRQNEFIQLTFQIVALLTKQKFKILSNAFVDLKKNKQRNAQKIVIMFNFKILFRRLILKNISFSFYKIVCYNRNNQGAQCSNVDIIKNLSVISSKLNSGLNQAHMKYQRKRRNLIIYKYLSKINMNENQMISKQFTKWKRILNQFNFQMRIKIIQQSKELEDDQQLLVQQYKQLSIENSELQQMYQQVQTYFHTPTGLSVKKSETKQNQQIIQGQQQQQQQQAFLLQSQQQEAFWDEDLIQSEDYSPEFVENIENQNVELKYKIEEQQAKRNMYLEEFQSRKQELLQQIALKKQIQKVQ